MIVDDLPGAWPERRRPTEDLNGAKKGWAAVGRMRPTGWRVLQAMSRHRADLVEGNIDKSTCE